MAFIPNPNFGRELAADPDHREGLKSAAASVAAKAEGFANRVMPRPGAEQIVVEETEEGVAVINTDYGAHLDEFGSVNNPPNAPLRRGARAAGLRLEDSPK